MKVIWLILAIALGALMIVCGFNYPSISVICGMCGWLCYMKYLYEKRK